MIEAVWDFQIYKASCFEQPTPFLGSPRGFGEQGNIGKIVKGTREHKPIFREQGNKTVQIRGEQIWIKCGNMGT